MLTGFLLPGFETKRQGEVMEGGGFTALRCGHRASVCGSPSRERGGSRRGDAERARLWGLSDPNSEFGLPGILRACLLLGDSDG